MATRLIIDTSNILFRIAAMNSKHSHGTSEEKAGLALHVTFQSINKYYRQFRPDHLAFAFEGTNNWRKEYTKGPDNISGKVYKANRVKDKSMEPFFELISAFKDVMESNTAAECLMDDNCEADDVIAAYTEMFKDDEVIIISADKDFMQLYKYPNVKLIDPATGKDRKEEWEKKNKQPFDPYFFMFEKCVRGDGGDHVPSAFPRVRKARIEKAFNDEYAKVEFMKEEWTNEDDKVFVVGDLFLENKLLMDLECQPRWVREQLFETLKSKVNNPGKYSNFHFLRFLGKYGMINIAENINQYADMLACKKIDAPKHSYNSNITLKKNKTVDENVEIEDRTKKDSNVNLLSF